MGISASSVYTTFKGVEGTANFPFLVRYTKTSLTVWFPTFFLTQYSGVVLRCRHRTKPSSMANAITYVACRRTQVCKYVAEKSVIPNRPIYRYGWVLQMCCCSCWTGLMVFVKALTAIAISHVYNVSLIQVQLLSSLRGGLAHDIFVNAKRIDTFWDWQASIKSWVFFRFLFSIFHFFVPDRNGVGRWYQELFLVYVLSSKMALRIEGGTSFYRGQCISKFGFFEESLTYPRHFGLDSVERILECSHRPRIFSCARVRPVSTALEPVAWPLFTLLETILSSSCSFETVSVRVKIVCISWRWSPPSWYALLEPELEPEAISTGRSSTRLRIRVRSFNFFNSTLFLSEWRKVTLFLLNSSRSFSTVEFPGLVRSYEALALVTLVDLARAQRWSAMVNPEVLKKLLMCQRWLGPQIVTLIENLEI